VSGLAALNWTAHALLGVGLFAPCMTVTPRMGEYTGLGRWLGVVGDARTYSVFGGVRALLEGSAPLLGAVLFLFSIVFPLSKLILLRAGLARPDAGHTRYVAALSKYSMVDVFVIALLIIASKSYPGGTTVDVHYGAFCFGAAALITIPVAGRLAAQPVE